VAILFGISEDIGWRDRMEDAHAIREMEGFFSAEVYDGHFGSLAAQTASIVLTPYFRLLSSLEAGAPGPLRLERELLREAYLKTDALIVGRGIVSGTAAATLYIMMDRFLAANVGDVRIVMGTAEGGRVLTLDHKPDLASERARIEALGGRVVLLDIPRVQGELALSRALGIAHLKPYVTAEPRIVEGYLGRENDYAIIACDGVWNVLGPKEVLDLARAAGQPQKAADLILSRSLDAGSTDNITVIVLDLREVSRDLERDGMEISATLDRQRDRKAPSNFGP
jgi:serine/threonine protein phosphatase PrpC